MPNFRFDGDKIFITYPQSGELTQAQVVDKLRTLADIQWARVCIEQHQDGQPHIHAICKWTRRVTFRRARELDIGDKHPNILRIRSVPRAITYVSKDGQFIDIGTVPAAGDPDANWVELAGTLTEAEYFQRAMQANIGYMYANRFWQIGNREAATVGEDYESNLQYESETLQELELDTKKCTVLVGPTGTGKTSWSKRVSPKPALWVRHLDVLQSFRPGYHKSIIFDDMDFKHYPRTAQIHLTDTHDAAQIHVRYRIAYIPENTVKIFTANEYPFSDDPAIERRVNLINLY